MSLTQAGGLIDAATSFAQRAAQSALTGMNTGTNSTSGGSNISAANAADLAYLNDEESLVQRLLQSTERTLADGTTSINDSYNKEVSGVNENRSRALENYGIQRDDTTRAKQGALGKVDTNARTLSNSLRRMLGMASGSDSSAYNITAPNAVARQATEQRTGVLGDYGANFRDIEMSEKNAKSDFETLLADIAAQRQSRTQGLEGDIIEKRQGISTSLAEIAKQRALLSGGGYTDVRSAQAPHRAAIAGGQDALDGLFAKYRTAYNVKPVDVKIPELRDYTVDRANINANAQAGTANDPYSYFRPRVREDEKLA